MLGKDILIRALTENGVKHVFGSSGEENLKIAEHLDLSDEIELINVNSEQTAFVMAGNYTKFTGSVGVVILNTSKNGVSNSLTGIDYANFAGMPIFIITQEEDEKVKKTLEKHTKVSLKFEKNDDFFAKLEYGYKKAFEEKYGCIHLSISNEILEQDFGINEEVSFKFQKNKTPTADEQTLLAFKKLLENAEAPLIMVGGSANRGRVIKELTKFILKTGMPFFSTINGKGVLDERLSHGIGTLAVKEHDYIHNAINESDLILAVGYNSEEKLPKILKNNHKKIIHINFESNKNNIEYFPTLEVVGDIGNTFKILYEMEVDDGNWGFGKIYKISEENKEKIKENTMGDFEDKLMTPRRLAYEIRKNFDDEDILTLDNGLFKIWFARNYSAYAPNSILLSSNYNLLGAGIGAGIVAKLCNKKKKVVTVCGDGGFIKSLCEIQTANRLGVDMVIIILNNASYSEEEWLKKIHGITGKKVTGKTPDFIKMAESMGARGIKIKKSDDFLDSFKKSLNLKGITILDLDFNYPDIIK